MALILLSPLIFIIFFILFINNKGKVFFFQKRPGKNEKIFEVIKFKTMTDKKDKQGNLLSDAQRLTKMGTFIRKTSLDEIPQLLNVLKGDMSLIGPRPLLPEYLSLYDITQKKRHNVKPGITGWAQVNGRNAISWAKKFEYDIWYIENLSFILDMKILFQTVIKVVKSEDINTENQATTKKFEGN
tara:strand:+ start:2020 stop:2574 length:555 start_codon:yes stop_codon:yes gene_type:complete